MALANPSRDWISVANLPVQTFLRLPHRSTNSRVYILYQLSHRVHVSRLKPRFLDILGIFMRYNPVELVTIPKSVLDEMNVVSDPNVDAFFFNEFAAKWIFFEI